MARRHRQLRVRDPDVFLLLPTTPLAHRHTRILRTIPVDQISFVVPVPRLAPRPARDEGWTFPPKTDHIKLNPDKKAPTGRPRLKTLKLRNFILHSSSIPRCATPIL